jgi:hypothetical protein
MAESAQGKWIGIGFLLVIGVLVWIAVELHEARTQVDPPLEVEPIGLEASPAGIEV